MHKLLRQYAQDMHKYKDQDFAFKGELGDYYRVMTDDGSWSLYSSSFDETCHSSSGAEIETQHVYIHGAGISRHAMHALAHKKDLTILEVGLGTGMGVILSLNFLSQYFPDLSVSLYSLEIDPAFVFWLERNEEFRRSFIKIATAQDNTVSFKARCQPFSLHIVIGDARKSIRPLIAKGLKVQAIYQDAFGPRKNQTLWTVQWFEQLKQIADANATLSTYCSAIAARKALQQAGWGVRSFPGIGRKRSNTFARLLGETDPKLLQQFEASPILAFTDLTCDDKIMR